MQKIKASLLFATFLFGVAAYAIPAVGNIFLSVVVAFFFAWLTRNVMLHCLRFSSTFINTLDLIFIGLCAIVLRISIPYLDFEGLTPKLLWSEFVLAVIVGTILFLHTAYKKVLFPGDRTIA